MNMRLGLRSGTLVLAGLLATGLEGCKKAEETAAATAPSTTVGAEIDDSIVTARVAAALLAEFSARSYGYKIETRKGEVQLSGFADSQADIERAVQVVRAVPGVKNVDNKVSVKTADSTVGNKIDDGIVTAKVKAALVKEKSVKGFDIAVATNKGEVQLSGFVDNQAQIDRALEIARGVEGVRTVNNKLSIKK
jgi:hyperosmotically inducible periplasmic protein